MNGDSKQLIYVIACAVAATFILILAAARLVMALAPWETTYASEMSFQELRTRINQDEKLILADQERVQEHQQMLADQIGKVSVSTNELTQSVTQLAQSVAVLNQEMVDSGIVVDKDEPIKRHRR